MSSSNSDETLIFIIFLITLILFTVVGSYMETKHFIFGHETGVVIIFGMILSLIVYQFDSHEEGERLVVQFNSLIFFDLLLPGILFAAGYNMRRKEFFNNFVNITKFGIFGSLFTFVIFVVLNWLLFKVGNL